MFEVTACPVCDRRTRRDLVSFPRDPYLRRLPSRTDHTVRYVICTTCGFVYQPRMMDEAEMELLYGSRYRLNAPPDDYLAGTRGLAYRLFSWITERTGFTGPGRKVLDIGCATGMFLRPFIKAGWTAIGLDAASSWIEYGRREFGLDLRAEFFTRDSVPGERFDLIIFSHVLEHVLDPAPVLAAIREKLTDDGYVFIGTPSILAPNRKLHPGLFGGDHVRLFSPRTIRIYLRRHGLLPVLIETHPPRGLCILAVKADPTPAPDLQERDDWRLIMALYRGLLAPKEATILERNLASLVERQEPALEALCRRMAQGLYRIRMEGGEADNVLIRRPDGTFGWLYGREGSVTRARLLLERSAPSLQGCSGPMLLRGFGLGHFAQSLEAALDPSVVLHIWEPDPALMLTALASRDFGPFFRSPRVHLHLGEPAEFVMRLAGGSAPLMVKSVSDPQDPRTRHPMHDEIPYLFKVRAPEDDTHTPLFEREAVPTSG